MRTLHVVCVAVCLSFLGCAASAQDDRYEFLWVRTFHGPCCGDMGVDLVVDEQGAAYVAGHRGGIDLDYDGTVDLGVVGLQDSLVFQSAENGSKGWVQGPGSPGMDEAKGVALDGRGGVYVVGQFDKGVLRIGDETLANRGGQDGYVARYDDKGKLAWARPIGGAQRDQLHGVAADPGGGVFVSGMVTGAVDVDRDGTDDVDAGEGAMLLASFDEDGRLRWAKTSAGAPGALGRTLKLGVEGELYVAGHYREGAVDLDADGEIDGAAISGSQPNGFVARFDPSGAMRWSQIAASAGVQSIASIAVAADGDLLVLGGGFGSVDFDGDGKPEIEGEARTPQAYLVRFSPEGAVRWARALGGSPAHVSATKGRIGLAGFYESGPLDLDLDGRSDGPADADTYSQGFVAVLDESGALQHTFIIDGAESDRALAGGFTADGRQFFATGYLRLTADFDADGQPESGVRCDALGDAFLALYQLPPVR